MITLRLLQCILIYSFTCQNVKCQSYEQFIRLDGHEAEITFLTFHIEEKTLVSGDAKGQIIIWDVEEGKTLNRFLGHTKKITHLAFNSTGTCLLYTSPSPRDATLSRMPSSA